VTENEESDLPETVGPSRNQGEESEAIDDETREGSLSEDTDALHVEMGAALDVDEDAVEAAAQTSLHMEGFETGAGFDLDDVPDDVGQHVEVEAIEIESTVIEDVEDPERAETEWPDPSDASDEVSEGRQTSFEEADPDSVDAAVSKSPDAPVSKPADAGAPRPASAKVSQKVKYVDHGAAGRKKSSSAKGLGAAVSMILLLGAGGLALAFFGVVEIPGITPPDRIRFTVPAPITPPGPQPESPVMSHVLYVDAWREDQTPQAWADALQERMPDLLGLVTPLLIGGDTRYALLVGPAYSASEATRLRSPLAEALALLNPDPDGWAVQEAPYSFYFGEYQSLDEANGRVQELAGLSVPAFVFQVTYPGGGGALRVYAGAFSDAVQAEGMGRILNENSMGEVPLTERRGRLSA